MFDVTKDESIKSLQKRIEERFGIPVRFQRLYFEEKELSDFRTISGCNIKDGDRIKLYLKPEGPMKVTLEMGDGKFLSCTIQQHSKLSSIKALIEEEESIPIHDQVWFRKGIKTALSDDYKIEDADVLVCKRKLKLKGSRPLLVKKRK